MKASPPTRWPTSSSPTATKFAFSTPATATVQTLGGDFNVSSKKLKDLTFSAGTLSPDFASGTNSYTLTVGYDVKSLTVTPTAENRLFQVHTFVGDTHYKRTASIPVQDGMVITVVCGGPAGPPWATTASRRRPTPSP